MAITVGSQKLKQLTLTQVEKADRLGANRSLVQFWEKGERKPNAAWIVKIEEQFGIPQLDWSVEPIAPVCASVATKRAKPTAPPADDEPDPSDIIGGGRAQLLRIAQMRATITDPRLAVRLEETERACRHTLAVYLGEGRNVSESVLLRSPAFARVLDKIRAALRNHPEALLDVAEALESIGD